MKTSEQAFSIHRLDGRFTYHKWFQYYIGFSHRMSSGQGPLRFNQAQKWFTDTYGWSAEVRQYDEIVKWNTKSVPLMRAKGGWISPMPEDLPDVCNPHWSWTNVYGDLRIYVATDKELSFFQLAQA